MISSSRCFIAKSLYAIARPILPTVAVTNTVERQGLRFYRGEAGEESSSISDHEQKLVDIALPKSVEILRKHVELPANDLVIRQKRLVYRAKQRGWLEVDLLLGTYASKNVPNMDENELDQVCRKCIL